MKPARAPRVLHVITGLGTGGAEESLLRVLRTIADPANHAVVSLTTTGSRADDLRSLGIPVHALGLARGRVTPAAFQHLRRITRDWSPDVIQGWMYHGNLAASMLRLSRAHRGPVCWNIRHALDGWETEPRTLRALVFASARLSSGAAHIIYNSGRSSAQHAARGVASAGVTVIPNGVDLARFAEDRGAAVRLRASWGIPAQGRVVGLVARVHPLKDHRTFLEAAARVAEQNEQAWFVLAGAGTEAGGAGGARSLDAMVNDVCLRVPILRSRLVRLGERTDVAAILSACDVVAMTSISEGSPNAAAEAMACGRPCVVTDVGDAATLVGGPGIVVQPRDSARMAEAWLSLLSDDAERDRRGAAARARVAAHYSPAAEAAAYLTVWNRAGGARFAVCEPRLLLAATVATTLRSFLLPFAREMRTRGWRVDGVANGASTCLQAQEAMDSVFDAPWSRRITDLRALVRSPARIRALVEQGGYDVVHVHTPIAAMLTRFALRASGPTPRVIYTAHGFHAHPSGGGLSNFCFRLAERAAARWTDYLVVINADDEQLALRDGLARRGFLQRHPGIGVDITQYSAPTREVRDATRLQLGIAVNEPVFAIVAEFNRNKRQRDVVRALARLRDHGHATLPVLLFIGEGPRRDRISREANALGLAERVRFLGQRSDVPALVGACDALILASEREGLPRCLLEAMSMRVPAIASTARGSRDLLADGRGLLFPAGDIPALASAMRYVIDDRKAAAVRAERARAWVCEHASLGKLLALHVALYEAACSGLPTDGSDGVATTGQEEGHLSSAA